MGNEDKVTPPNPNDGVTPPAPPEGKATPPEITPAAGATPPVVPPAGSEAKPPAAKPPDGAPSAKDVAYQKVVDASKQIAGGNSKPEDMEALRTAQAEYDKLLEAEKPKPAEPEKPKEDVKYDLKAPKDSPVDAQDLSEIAEIAKTQKLTPEAAQALVDNRHQILSSRIQRELQGFKDQESKWLSELQKDPILGGKAWAETGKKVALAADTIFGKGFSKLLLQNNNRYNPVIVRGLYGAYEKFLSDGTLVPPEAPADKGSAHPSEPWKDAFPEMSGATR